MAKASAPMEIDDNSLPSSRTNKGKSLLASDPKSAPWVEKYRPQSLADVAAHRDIIDTSIFFSVSLSLFPILFSSPFLVLIVSLFLCFFGGKSIVWRARIGYRIFFFTALRGLERHPRSWLLLGSFMERSIKIWFWSSTRPMKGALMLFASRFRILPVQEAFPSGSLKIELGFFNFAD